MSILSGSGVWTFILSSILHACESLNILYTQCSILGSIYPLVELRITPMLPGLKVFCPEGDMYSHTCHCQNLDFGSWYTYCGVVNQVFTFTSVINEAIGFGVPVWMNEHST